MRPEPDFYAPDSAANLPELRLWRAVLTRAILDVQHGSQAQARDVMKWIGTRDFERLVVWAGFELEQGRFAARWLRETFAERFERHGNASDDADEATDEACGQDEIDKDLMGEEASPHANALLMLIFTARDITRAKKRMHARAARRRLPPSLSLGQTLQPR